MQVPAAPHIPIAQHVAVATQNRIELDATAAPLDQIVEIRRVPRGLSEVAMCPEAA